MTPDQLEQFRATLQALHSSIAKGDADNGSGPVFLRGWNACLEAVTAHLNRVTCDAPRK